MALFVYKIVLPTYRSIFIVLLALNNYCTVIVQLSLSNQTIIK